MKRLLALLLFASSTSALAQQTGTYGGVETVTAPRTWRPGRAPANDQFPPRTQLRAPTVGVNDNFARGIGKTGAQLGDDLVAAGMSSDEAARRQARYIKGVGQAISGTGGATYGGRLARLGKLAKPVGYILTLASLVGVAFDIFGNDDGAVEMREGASHVDDGSEAFAASAANGLNVFTSRFIVGAYYPNHMNIWNPDGDFPSGVTFISLHANTGSVYLNIAVPYSGAPIDYSIQRTGTWTVAGTTYSWVQYRSTRIYNGKQYLVLTRHFGDNALWAFGYLRSVASSGWVLLQASSATPQATPGDDIQQSEDYPGTGTTVDQPLPADASVSGNAARPAIQKGLQSAGISAPDSYVDKLANQAGAGLKGSDLNTAPDPETWTNPATSPAGSYLPQPAHDALQDPNLSTDPDVNIDPDAPPSTDPNPNPNPSPSTVTLSDGSLQVDGNADDLSWLPKISVGSLSVTPDTCPSVQVPEIPKNGRYHTLDIGCAYLEDPNYKPFLRGIAFAMACLIGFRAFRSGV